MQSLQSFPRGIVIPGGFPSNCAPSTPQCEVELTRTVRSPVDLVADRRRASEGANHDVRQKLGSQQDSTSLARAGARFPVGCPAELLNLSVVSTIVVRCRFSYPIGE